MLFISAIKLKTCTIRIIWYSRKRSMGKYVTWKKKKDQCRIIFIL